MFIQIKETVTMSLGHPVPHVSHEEMPKQNGRALHEYELGSEKITFINQCEMQFFLIFTNKKIHSKIERCDQIR